MTDMREKQPEKNTFDWTHRTKGNAVYKIRLWCPVYHGIKNEDVYPKKPTYLIRSLDFETAVADARLIAATLQEAHDIWQVEIEGVEKQ